MQATAGIASYCRHCKLQLKACELLQATAGGKLQLKAGMQVIAGCKLQLKDASYCKLLQAAWQACKLLQDASYS